MANFWFLAAYTSFAISLLILIRQFITALVHDKSLKIKSILTIFFVVLNIIVGYYTYTNIISIFPIIAGIIATISMFMFKNGKLRLSLLVCELCWFVNNIYYINIGGLIANVLNVSIHIKNIIHFKKEDKSKI